MRCTWDETTPDRYDIFSKKYKADELEELDMNDYLASESGEWMFVDSQSDELYGYNQPIR